MTQSGEVYGHVFEIQDTATVTETQYDWNTGIAYVAGAPRLRPRKLTIVNDSGSVALLYTTNGNASSAANIQHSLAAGETITHNVISPGLWVESASTTAFRAWGEG